MSARRLFLIAFLALAAVTALAPAAPASASPAPGTLLWSSPLGAGGADDAFWDSARCPDGGVVAVGFTNFGAPGTCDALICKFSPSGMPEWSDAYDNGDTLDDSFDAVVVDKNGNIYAGGGTNSPATGNDYLVVKYDKNGVRKWGRGYDGGVSRSDASGGLLLDAAGNAWVTGSSMVSSAKSVLWTMKLRAFDGDVLLSRRYPGPAGTQWVNPWGFARGPKGSFYASGSVENASAIVRVMMVRLSSTAKVTWARAYRPAGVTAAWGVAAVTGTDGTPYFLATSDRSAAGKDVLLLHYSGSGSRRFVKTYDSGPATADWAQGLAVDGDGTLFSTVRSGPASGLGTRAVAIRWTPAGVRRWVRAYPAAGLEYSEYRDLLPDQKGGVYVAGQFKATGSTDVTAMIRHVRGTGALAWSRVQAHAPGNDSFDTLAFCGSAGISAAGRWLGAAGPPPDQDAIIVKWVK